MRELVTKVFSVGYSGDHFCRVHESGLDHLRAVECSNCRHVPHGGRAVLMCLAADCEEVESPFAGIAEATIGLIKAEAEEKRGSRSTST
jgi:hypothetical protein